jgi:XTP/dITP diphosphohydrolase
MTEQVQATLRLAAGDTLVIATHNAGKLKEIGLLLAPFDIKSISAASLGLPEPAETGHMFAENAAIKAHAAAASGMAALADDSGMCADALDGAPGLFTADWAGSPRDFVRAMQRTENELQLRGATTPGDRRAHFVSALVLALPDGRQALFEGRVFGQLIWPPRGEHGFGYDPMFVPDGQPDGQLRTFGEMLPDEKLKLDHRSRAFAKFEAACLW